MKINIFNIIIEKIEEKERDNVVIGIDGGQGSGKSTFTEELQNYLRSILHRNSVHLETDDFLIERAKRKNLSLDFFTSLSNLNYFFDFDRMSKIIKKFQTSKNKIIVLNNLYNTKTGRRDRIKRYRFVDKNIIIVGGPYLLSPSFPQFDLKIFIHAERQTRLRNTLKRTLNKQRSIKSQTRLFNNFELFYIPYFSRRLFDYDLIVNNTDFENKKIFTANDIFDLRGTYKKN